MTKLTRSVVPVLVGREGGGGADGGLHALKVGRELTFGNT